MSYAVRRSINNSGSGCGCILLVLAFAALIGLDGFVTFSTKQTVTITVKDKERVTVGTGKDIHSKYLVYCDGETFENRDEMWFGKFNSSDLQGALERGKTYRVTVCGYRIPFFSTHRNIIGFSN